MDMTKIGIAIRMLLRLRVLHRHGQLTSSEWTAVQTLESSTTHFENSTDLDWRATPRYIETVRRMTHDDLSQSVLEDLFVKVESPPPVTNDKQWSNTT